MATICWIVMRNRVKNNIFIYIAHEQIWHIHSTLKRKLISNWLQPGFCRSLLRQITTKYFTWHVKGPLNQPNCDCKIFALLILFCIAKYTNLLLNTYINDDFISNSCKNSVTVKISNTIYAVNICVQCFRCRSPFHQIAINCFIWQVNERFELPNWECSMFTHFICVWVCTCV